MTQPPTPPSWPVPPVVLAFIAMLLALLSTRVDSGPVSAALVAACLVLVATSGALLAAARAGSRQAQDEAALDDLEPLRKPDTDQP